MKTSPFSPWSDEAPASPAESADASASLLQQAAEQLSEAASRLAALDPSTPSSGVTAIQITVTTPLGEPLPFTSDAGPDLTLLS